MSVAVAPIVQGRSGPAICILSTISPTDGGHLIKQHLLSTRAQRDMPTFIPHGVTFTSGRWYHEVTLNSENCMQIGYCIRKKFRCILGRQEGVGDDTASWSIDGSKKRLYQAKKSFDSPTFKWEEKDIMGFALDIEQQKLTFSKNGKDLYTAILGAESDYRPGDELIPAASLTSGNTITWAFTADKLKYLPQGFSPLQLVATPAEWLLDPNEQSEPLSAPILDRKTVDPLDDPHLLMQLLECCRPVRPINPRVQQGMKHWIELRGGAWEYGLTWHMDRTGLNSINKSFEGEYPWIKCANSFARDGEVAVDEMRKVRVFRRTMVQWIMHFLSMYCEEQSAAEFIETTLKPFIYEKLLNAYAQYIEKVRYIEALESRKHKIGNGNSIKTMLEWFDKDLAKAQDTSKLSASDNAKLQSDLATEAQNLRDWIVWWKTRVGDIPIHAQIVDLITTSLLRWDAM